MNKMKQPEDKNAEKGMETSEETPGGTGAGEAAAKPENDKNDIVKCVAERDQYYNMMLRARADLENLSKRVQREKEQWRQAILRDFVKDMLPALDALCAAAEHAGETESGVLLEGVRLTEKKLVEIFSRNGVEILEPRAGDKFDPAVHEAVMSVPSKDHAPGHIVSVMRRGYRVSGNLVRAAQVGVSESVADTCAEEGKGAESPGVGAEPASDDEEY